MSRPTKSEDPYRVLGVPRDASPEAIKRAFRQKAKDSHPDKNPSDESAAERFRGIHEAYQTLSDKKKRAEYDRFGSTGQSSPEDFFSNFFRGFAQQRDGAFQMRSTVSYELSCTLEELYNGTVKKMKVKRSGGPGKAPSEVILEVNVRAGCQPGTKILFRGEGEEVSPGVAQDIVFVIKELPHARFTRVGPNLVTKLSVPLADALCGFTIKVEMLDGSLLEIPVEDVIRPGFQLKVPGRGFPRARAGAPPGDLLVEFDLLFPKALTDAQKERIRLAFAPPSAL
jgi:DnaJ family protein B protein 4